MLGLTLGWLRLCSFRFKESFPTLLPGALTILNTETWLVGLLCMKDPEKKKVCWEETLALVWLLVPSAVPAFTGCFPQSVFNILFSYVSIINLFQLFGPLSFSQIKAKWFYLMYHFLCLWPGIHVYKMFYLFGTFTYTRSSFAFAT